MNILSQKVKNILSQKVGQVKKFNWVVQGNKFKWSSLSKVGQLEVHLI